MFQEPWLSWPNAATTNDVFVIVIHHWRTRYENHITVISSRLAKSNFTDPLRSRVIFTKGQPRVPGLFPKNCRHMIRVSVIYWWKLYLHEWRWSSLGVHCVAKPSMDPPKRRQRYPRNYAPHGRQKYFSIVGDWSKYRAHVWEDYSIKLFLITDRG